MTEQIEYPVRINKYLALKKMFSRRESDSIIQEKKVFINGKLAVLGDKVNKGDIIKVKDAKKNLVYLAFYKPKGIVTHSAQKNEREIKDIFNFPEKIFPVGRLDKDSHGLIILTNDGLLTDYLLNPENNHEKEYLVQVNKKVTPQFLENMKNGVVLDDGYLTKKCFVRKMKKDVFSIVLTEGKKRQIRRMCDSLGYSVLDLKRVRIMNIKVDDLKPKEFREITGKELKEFLGNFKNKKRDFKDNKVNLRDLKNTNHKNQQALEK